MGIAGRAISTMITASGYNDVLRMYNNTQRDVIGFNLAYIGSDFKKELPAPFDQDLCVRCSITVTNGGCAAMTGRTSRPTNST